MRVRKKRLSWNRSVSPGVAGYRLYWSETGNVSYDSDHADLGNVIQVVLPDDIPSFPQAAGLVRLGITALGPMGNESDMARVMVRFEPVDAEEARLVRLRPGVEGWEPPLNAPVLIDGLNQCVIENIKCNESLSHRTRCYFYESHYIEPFSSSMGQNGRPRVA